MRFVTINIELFHQISKWVWIILCRQNIFTQFYSKYFQKWLYSQATFREVLFVCFFFTFRLFETTFGKWSNIITNDEISLLTYRNVNAKYQWYFMPTTLTWINIFVGFHCFLWLVMVNPLRVIKINFFLVVNQPNQIQKLWGKRRSFLL